MSIRKLCVVIVLFCALNLLPDAFAQAITSATLTGRVEDPSGAVLGGATVELVNTETDQTWTSDTDSHGSFRSLNVPAGNYRMKVAAAGFAVVSQTFVLTVGQAMYIPVTLPLATSSQSVEVNTQAPVIELIRTQVSETVTPHEVDRLPLNGRNYLDLALLVPGASRTNTGASQRFAETSAVPGTGISMSGQRNMNNGFVVDGLSASDDAADLAGTFYSQEVIREFQVVTTGGIAEFGRASSGTVNIVTHSGTNGFHGGAYGYMRNQRMDAANPLATQKDPLTQAQYGATFGGPIAKDRTFFFGNFEQTRQHAAGIITITPESVSAINDRLSSVGYGGPQIETGKYPSSMATTNFFVRLDHRLNDSNQLTARYSLYDVAANNVRNIGGLNAASRAANLDDRDQNIAISETSTLSSHMLNDLRMQFSRSNLAAPVNDVIGPAVNISGVASFGTATASPTARKSDVFEIVDSVSFEKGAYSLKAGVDLLYERVNIGFPGAVQGVYTFSSLPNFVTGRYATFQQAFGVADQFQSNPNVGAFAQNQWRVRRDVTLNLGVRYDVQLLADAVNPGLKNIAPRLGIAWAPGGGTKTVVRASYGMYYDRIPLRALSNALQRDGLQYKVAVIPFGTAGAPVFPNVLPAFPTNLLTSITSINPNIDNAYSQQASLQVERELSQHLSLAVGYSHLRGEHLIMSRNVNVPTSSTSPNLGRPDPRFGNNGQYDSIGDSYYDGLTVSLNERLSRWGNFRVSYNLSKSIDTSGNFFFSTPQDNFDIRGERGLSDNDQRHRVSVSGTLQMPKGSDSTIRKVASGFRFAYVFAYTSALPFNIQTGTDRNGDTTVNDRPIHVGRNTGRGYNFTSLDLRLSRVFKLGERLSFETLAEGFNVLNRRNDQVPNNIFGAGSLARAGFGLPTAAGDPRQVQIGMKLTF